MLKRTTNPGVVSTHHPANPRCIPADPVFWSWTSFQTALRVPCLLSETHQDRPPATSAGWKQMAGHAGGLPFSPTPGSLGRSDISLINDLITAEASKGAQSRARIPEVRSKLALNAMRRDFFARASPKCSPLPTLTQIIAAWGPLRAGRQKREAHRRTK